MFDELAREQEKIETNQMWQLPCDPEEFNDDRAQRAGQAVVEYSGLSYFGDNAEDNHTALKDLLCDLHHWADRVELDFDAVLQSSQLSYQQETFCEDNPFCDDDGNPL
jgi:hypothetical protein